MLLTTYYLLLTTHYLLLTTHYSLLTTYDSLLTTHYSLLTTHDSLLTTHGSRFTTHDSLLTTLPTTYFAYSVRDALGLQCLLGELAKGARGEREDHHRSAADLGVEPRVDGRLVRGWHGAGVCFC